jgi:hypothetical protein
MIRLFIGYVDPSSGSFVIQAVVGSVMGVSYMARTRIKLFMSKFKKEPQADKHQDN